MSGSIAANFHEGSRSEILADYLFSAWGTVSPVRRQDDYGIDLYCTLTERVGQRKRVQEYFSAQERSVDDPWIFNDRDSVEWLVRHPVPLFLCTINKKEGVVRVYQVFQRFYIWVMGSLPDRVELKLEHGVHGRVETWNEGSSYSLSVPIIEAGLRDLVDAERMEHLRQVFSHWVRLDRENCDFVRQGLLRFRMPHSYTVNEVPYADNELELTLPDVEFLNRGILQLAEAIECLGGQLGRRGNYAFALEAALLLDRLQKEHKEVFEPHRRWQHRVPGRLGSLVNQRLNQALGDTGSHYWYRGLEAVEKLLAEHPLVIQYLRGQSLNPTDGAADDAIGAVDQAAAT
jgi:hypothetical protein